MTFVRVLCFALLVGLAAACHPECSRCPPMWSFYKGHCYRYFGFARTFDAAENHCKQFTKVGQAHLVAVSNIEENDFLSSLARTVTGANPSLWLGYNDRKKEGSFARNDRQAFDFANWNKGEPNNIGKGGEDCVHLLGSGKWNDIKCDKKYDFVCKMETTQ